MSARIFKLSNRKRCKVKADLEFALIKSPGNNKVLLIAIRFIPLINHFCNELPTQKKACESLSSPEKKV